MPLTLHKDLPIDKVHIPYSFTYADATARNGATGLTEEDEGKFARQLSNNSIWMLTDHTGPTWVQVGASGGGGEAFPVDSIFITVSDNAPEDDLGYGTWELVGSVPLPIGSITGGIVSEDGDYTIHTFNSSGTLELGDVGSLTIEYLIIAGGGGGGRSASTGFGAGGGGAGGYLSSTTTLDPNTSYPVNVGNGGNGATTDNDTGFQGGNSTFNGLTAIGGGGGRRDNNSGRITGGSGGGGFNANAGGAGTSGQGFNGGGPHPASDGGCGGGGAGGVGLNGGAAGIAGAGGPGLSSSITGTSITRAGGGGGSSKNTNHGAGGSGGGGAGGVTGTAGTANTGSGGGGGRGGNGGSGGSGVVIIRYTKLPLPPLRKEYRRLT
jgi:hypothetical protein